MLLKQDLAQSFRARKTGKRSEQKNIIRRFLVPIGAILVGFIIVWGIVSFGDALWPFLYVILASEGGFGLGATLLNALMLFGFLGSLMISATTVANSARMEYLYTVDQIKMAITGCSMTPHNMGQNDNNKKYDDIELICRDGVKVETFASNCQEILPLKQKQQMSSFPEMDD